MGLRPSEWEPHELVAVFLAGVVGSVLTIIVIDLVIAARLSEDDRTSTLAALGAIGLALAGGLGAWLHGSVRKHGDDDEPDTGT